MSISAARVRPVFVARHGFTMVELVVVLGIATVLLSITFSALNQVASQRSAQSARDAYVWMARRARAAAIQRGTPVRFTISSVGRATVAVVNSGRILDQIYFKKEFGTTVTLASDSVAVRYDPRGLAKLSTPATVQFSRGSTSAAAKVQLLGQVEAQ